ncbi:hypothetical protein ACKI1I_02215 [Streptomyces turgidiscabies]|uniref:Uncharacterized protein n=1 Tax=Streptomyces turgidiscabies (strain Car8) TaxID=698760 RepID=L7F1C1_STRT8|nr:MULTISPECIES: hypothetical protein [Streptomyces]ELP65458.1 hypothetical protein STRTUCAR8_05393 [Streptomyces turgidiscabies Car8]MDX3492288.1 hypothetical protein [Streptomyces turgidiscabies]GAQ69420.1 hypothetical protein T45_01144 [Streptomyces turgidiscabies]
MPGPNENPVPPGSDPLTETFAFACLECGAAWNRTFDLVSLFDPAGCLNPLEYVDEDGRAMHSPLTDAVCGACGSRKVRVG